MSQESEDYHRRSPPRDHEKGAYAVSFWKTEDGFLKQATAEDADSIEIADRRGGYKVARLDWPNDAYLADRIVSLLGHAFERGEAESRAAIRAVLGL